MSEQNQDSSTQQQQQPSSAKARGAVNSKLSGATVSRVQGGGNVMFFSSVSKGRGQGYAATESEVTRQLSRTGVIGGPSNGYRRHQNRVRERDQQNQRDTELYAQSVRDNAALDAQTLWLEKHTEDIHRRNNNNSSEVVSSSFDELFDFMTAPLSSSTHVEEASAPLSDSNRNGAFSNDGNEKDTTTNGTTADMPTAGRIHFAKRERSVEKEEEVRKEEGEASVTSRPKKKRSLLSKFE